MHGTALALAVAGFFAVQFGHHLLDVAALGNEMPVAAVGAGDIILIGQIQYFTYFLEFKPLSFLSFSLIHLFLFKQALKRLMTAAKNAPLR